MILAIFLFRLIVTEAAVNVGGGIGVGVGGGGGISVGGGINTSPDTPSAGAPQVSKLNAAYTALQTWKSAITDDPNGILRTWVGSNVCTYKGVFCADSQDSTGPVVAAIDLNHANLQGVLVKQLSELAGLSLIHLNSNRFSGTVPESFKEFSFLTELDLSNNKFSGPFPVTVLYIPNLKYLDLRFNSFSGSIPDYLFNKQLDAILLNNNQFDSELPQNLGNSPASVINLANNKFSGNLPFSLGYMGSRVKEILFLNNQLSGCIPEGVGLWSDLQVLDMQRPEPDCSMIPGDGLSCLRIPAKPLVCGAHQTTTPSP
ncbi:unnamed protein product [Fraxinus pennsylvanica]|uniref:Cell wall hydroxyproline-rich glycoprotein n=1 Tax=Fraxinus pennsylvanica TaxID=56036 RepID=A0AAD2A9Z8_9LAMI|nr:unnamed protein product [Fraxinus pennsylvanica]